MFRSVLGLQHGISEGSWYENSSSPGVRVVFIRKHPYYIKFLRARRSMGAHAHDIRRYVHHTK